ncbi:MAG: sensor histidine kinase [Planctomycetota bacterium]
MRLADFVESNRDRIIERWMLLVEERLALRLDDSQLRDHIPGFVKDLASALAEGSSRWVSNGSAESHGRQRQLSGIDVSTLCREMALVGETVLELAVEDEHSLELSEIAELYRAIASGTATSLTAYSSRRDDEISKQSADHVSFIAHELRTPLQSARFALMLLRQDEEAARPSHLDRLDRSLTEVVDLVDNSLLHARLDGVSHKHVQTHRGIALLESALDKTSDHAAARSISISVEGGEFAVEADHKLMVSALTNLLKNAVKFTRPHGVITVRASTQGSRAMFEVEDQCGGLPPDLPARLFQPFVQEGRDRSGFGLGLVIVKRAVESHGGSVRVCNHPGRGCTFVIDLPLRQANGDLAVGADGER